MSEAEQRTKERDEANEQLEFLEAELEAWSSLLTPRV